jgi:FAD/FMN-containing dehydrogenase
MTTAMSSAHALVASLRRALAGPVVTPDDPGYDDARRVWNADIDRRPLAVVRCSRVDDVAACVRLAAEHDVALAVRGGAHNVAGYGTCDGGLVADLSAMRAVVVDPEARVGRAQGGATWADFDEATQRFGLATTGGVVPTTGVGGLTLGGGIGWLKRRHGLTCDNLLAVEVVTADGLVVRASDEERPDLFFALRGGGGNFGIVTSFELRLHPVDVVLAGYVAHPVERLDECLRFFVEYAAEMPDELTMLLFVMVAEPHAPMPEHLWGRQVVLLGACWCGALDEGERVVAPLRRFGPPVLDALAPMSYLDFQRAFVDAPQALPGYGNYWKAEYLAGVPDDAVGVIVEHVERMTSPFSYVELDPIGGAIARMAQGATAVGFRDAPFLLQANAVWRPDDPDRDRHVAWSRAFAAAMAPYSTGATYLNFIGDEGTDRIRASFGPELYERLTAVKRVYDPANRFRVNQNIAPGGAGT